MSPRPYRYMIRTALLCATVLTASPTNADHSIQIAKLLADDGAAGDKFSFWPSAMAISGNTIVIGAVADDQSGINAGSVYVFANNGAGWVQQAKLLADDGVAGDEFGMALAISGDTIVVGARLDDDIGTSSGAAYVFVRSAGI